MHEKNEVDFIGIGAPKSGSTWLCQCMSEHPDIAFAQKKRGSKKELFFFNLPNVWGENVTGRLSYYDKGFDWYINQFPPPRTGLVRGEFSVSYMADPVACERIKRVYPYVKIISILRNPVDMIYSLHSYFSNGAVVKIPE